MTDQSSSSLNSKAELSSSPSTKKEPSKSFFSKFSKPAPEEPGKEKWRDASLNDKDRFKDWQKARDKGTSSTGYLTSFYKAKNGKPWWIGLFGGDGDD